MNNELVIATGVTGFKVSVNGKEFFASTFEDLLIILNRIVVSDSENSFHFEATKPKSVEIETPKFPVIRFEGIQPS